MNLFSIHIFKYYFLISGIVLCFSLQAQQTRESEEKVVADLMERWIENSDDNIDYKDLQDQLEYYLRNKIDLNKASREEFQQLTILDDETINSIIKHRNEFGEFLTVYELQTIENINERTLYYLSYFVKVGDNMFDDNTPFLQMILKGKQELMAMHENEFEPRSGYDKSKAEQGKQYYLGSQYRYVLRYRFNYGNKLNFGYAGEKDLGEQFFNGAQKYGFDFNSFHFVLRNTGNFKTIAIGDYQANFGQGLTFGSGLSSRKSAYVLNTRRNFQTIRPYRSLNENEFLRGAAISYQYKSIEVTGIFSYKYISTNYREVDSLSSNEDVFSSIQLTGLHRTSTENLNRNNVLQTIYGTHIKWRSDNFDIGLTAVNAFYDHTFQSGSKPYQLYNFSGKQLSNFGFDFNFYLGNANVFGEISNSSNGAFAGIAGLMIPLHQKLDMVVVYRNYAKKYQTTFNNPFGENSDGRNEEGFYTGLSFKPNLFWVFNSYFDLYRSPWLRYLTDAPSQGYDWLAELQYNPSKNVQFYVRYRQETKSKNLPTTDVPINYLGEVSREIIRLNAQYKISNSLSAKSRAEFVQYNDVVNGYKVGVLIFQDIIYATTFKDLSFTGRIALFNVEDYNARIYATENDVLYQYAVPQFQNSGIRYYLVVHYRINKQLDCWIKYAQTTYNNVNTISSGLDQINGNVLSNMRIQMRWIF